MAPLIRLFLFAIVIELGMGYSVSAAAHSLSHCYINNHHYGHSHQTVVVSSNGLSDIGFFELFEKEEQNEITEDDSHENFHQSIFGLLAVQSFSLHDCKKSFEQGFNDIAVLKSESLYVLFHCWKIHLLKF